MAKVNINGVTHQVEVEHDDLGQAVKVARKLWRETAPKAGGTAGPAIGFQIERGRQTLYGMDADGK